MPDGVNVAIRKIDMLNDYVAIMVDHTAENGPATRSKHSNEGVVVGVGPDAIGTVNVGERVLIRRGNHMRVMPASGCYKDRGIFMVRKTDLVARIPSISTHDFE